MAQFVNSAPQMARRLRKPAHPFNVRSTPFAITPMMIAPVLPGETLKQALLQARCISQPIKDGLIGWWAEFYLFYVKLNDLKERESFLEMVIDPGYDPAALTSTTPKAQHYFAAGAANPGIDYVQKCLEVVVEEFFRDGDEAWNLALIDGYPASRVVGSGVCDSAVPAARISATADVDVDGDGDGTITASEVEKARALWFQLTSQGLIDKTYQDFMRSYGVRATPQETHKPELIRYIRDWTYPTRIINPADGTPTQAVQWNVQERVDKDRFFREPGFVFGVVNYRPKIYMGNQKGTLTSHFKSALQWLPGEVLNNLAFGIERFNDLTGPLSTSTVDYVIDLRDLLTHGEQFTNRTIVSAGPAGNFIALPSTDVNNIKYPSLADVQGIFSVNANRFIDADGVCNLHIASMVAGDATPPTVQQ